MFHAQLKLVCPDTERFIRYENLSDQSLERLNAMVDTRMRELRPHVVVVNVKYWDDAFLWFRKEELRNGSD